MALIKFLGTSNAISYKGHANTCLAVENAGEVVLVDCPLAPMPRLSEADVDPLSIDHLIVTHFHPDHAAGVPVFLMNIWLMGRKEPITIHGLDDCVSRLQQMMDLYRWRTWPDCYPVEYHALDGCPSEQVLKVENLEILSSPVKHIIPAVGLLFRSMESRKAVVYSCDTAPSKEIVALARNAEVLIHEANGRYPGHSSAEQAGEVASEAAVGKLILVHYPSTISEEELRKGAACTFSGEIHVARDFDTLDF